MNSIDVRFILTLFALGVGTMLGSMVILGEIRHDLHELNHTLENFHGLNVTNQPNVNLLPTFNPAPRWAGPGLPPERTNR